MEKQKVEILDNNIETIIKINDNQIHNITEYKLTHGAMDTATLTITIVLSDKNIQIKK
nr:MAG TPA: hypothetical protein [Caudoviricetes sp.]